MNAPGFFWGTSIFVVHFFFGFQAVFHFWVDFLFFLGMDFGNEGLVPTNNDFEDFSSESSGISILLGLREAANFLAKNQPSLKSCPQN